MELEIRKTEAKDLKNVASLWNDGDVMKFVGFPEGLGVTTDQLKNWLNNINETPHTEHFSVYDKDLGYCGEAFYSADETHRLAALDIKLFKKSRGRGIARKALTHAIEEAFQTGVVNKVYVDPDPENTAAITLYDRLGFKKAERPSFLEPSKTHYELTYERFHKTTPTKKG